MDVEMLSKYCICLDKSKHEKSCLANFKGSGGSMEGAGARNIFHRFIETYNVRYLKYLGDGDSNSFESIVQSRSYGNHIEINKLEFVNHVMKRMGGRLRRLKISMKHKKLGDGKKLSGQNLLTDKRINTIQSYYGKAIRENKGDLQGMRKAVWAIYCHIGPSDEKPEHRLRPVGKSSWCKYNKLKLKTKLIHTKILYQKPS